MPDDAEYIGERNSPRPEHEKVDPRWRPGVARAIECTGQHHSVSVERKTKGNCAQARDRVPGHSRIRRKNGRNRPGERYEDHANAAEKRKVVSPRHPHRLFGAFWLPRAACLSYHRGSRV